MALKTLCRMKISIFFMVLILCSSSAYSQNRRRPSPVPTTAAPAPSPGYVNLTNLLTVAGPFNTFLHNILSTKVIETFQNQANDTQEGITIFVPKDDAFKSLKKQSLANNLTQGQLKQLLLFHALPHYYSLSDFKNLTLTGPVITFAGGDNTLNVTDVSGTIQIDSGWTKTKVSSSVYSTDPVAVYEVNRVLLPQAIFGTDVPSMLAPARAPGISPSADTPSGGTGKGASSSESAVLSSAQRMVRLGSLSQLGIVIFGVMLLLL